MKKSRDLKERTSALRNQVHNLEKLTDQVSQIGDRLKNISGRLSKINRNLEALEEHSPASAVNGSHVFELNRKIVPHDHNRIETSASCGECKIIQFRRKSRPLVSNIQPENSSLGHFKALTPFLAAPGQSLPQQLPDFRPALQRDGLILLAWDMRSTELGERYTAYWVTSAGIPRFYASRALPLPEFSSARPDHKSYAAEDGIEFYGQEAPHYMVHAAPELMRCNPEHRELRQAHISILKREGVTVDFNFKYLLSTEKHRCLPHKMTGNKAQNRAG